MASTGQRSKRHADLSSEIARKEAEVPGPILAHHHRLRQRGRDSTAPVRDWVCRSCFISVASGARTKLIQRSDISVCENCGSYTYLPDQSGDFPDDLWLQAQTRARAAKLAGVQAKKAPARVITPAPKKAKTRPSRPAQLKKKSRKKQA
ncbi:MAG: hypothetical protein HC904_14440 [Blastochloris sp.]|nr:hypothetical protein [Blastochloris sp.]